MRLHALRFGFVFSCVLAAILGASAHAQTTLAVSAFGAIANSATPNNSDFYRMSIASSAGGLFEYRRTSSAFFGWEASYSFRPANEVYNELIAEPVAPCPTSGCTFTDTYDVSAFAHQLTAAWVPSGPLGKNSRLFVLLGVGLLITHPTSSAGGATSATQPAYVYGVGYDWGLARNLGLRLQYRGDLYRPPNIFPSSYSNPDVGFMHTAEPSIGLYYQFF